jgi:hypothetical protein
LDEEKTEMMRRTEKGENVWKKEKKNPSLEVPRDLQTVDFLPSISSNQTPITQIR